MAIQDTTKKPYIIDRDSNIQVGMDLPIRRGDDKDGWFATSKTTMEAVKNNIVNLLSTTTGERLMQPNLGVDLRNILFEQVDESTELRIQDIILDAFEIWLPFVQVLDIKIVSDNIETDRNQIRIDIIFNIIQDPNTVDSVSMDFASGVDNSGQSGLVAGSGGGSAY